MNKAEHLSVQILYFLLSYLFLTISRRSLTSGTLALRYDTSYQYFFLGQTVKNHQQFCAAGMLDAPQEAGSAEQEGRGSQRTGALQECMRILLMVFKAI